MKKEKTIPFSSRINPTIKKEVVDYCDREGIIIQKFLEAALMAELEVRKMVVK